MSISTKFQTFCDNLRIAEDKVTKIQTRYKAITKRINADYWGWESETSNSLYVGSYGRDTDIHVSDIDMHAILPNELYNKFNKYKYNGQSALLQDLRRSLKKTYPDSHTSADRQVIVIPFRDGIIFEIVPVFNHTDGQSFIYADTKNGGAWKIVNPRAEINAIRDMNLASNYNLKRLCRMLRAWKDKNALSIGGLLLDTLAYNFISQWDHSDESFTFYDWMTRDCFEYIGNQSFQQKYWLAPGSNQHVFKKGSFISKAKNTHQLALKAIQYEESERDLAANVIWRQIYGSKFPLRMS